MGAQPSRHHGRLQAGRAAVTACAALAGLGLLSGCASMNPVNWFHSAEGGAIAKPHQAPPGQNQPYPNLATVPPTPPAPDMAALQHISDALIADRTNAQHLAAAAPLADPSSPTASPDLFGIGTTPPPGPPPPPGTPAASASLPAASAPPAPPAAAAATAAPAAPRVAAAPPPPQKAPVGTVQSAQLPDIATATQVPAGEVGTLPPVPTAPPPPAALTGVAAPPHGAASGAANAGVPHAVAPPVATAAASAPPRAVPPVAATRPPTAATNAATTVVIEFAPQSASVPPAALPALKALAAKRGNHVIEALGRGDAGSADPTAQQQAVTLGFARAQAIAAALAASGVPRGAIQVMALAAGSGGVAQLVE
jgi:outer membrane protein OmpA-like peptidoglycan-associated protein